MNRTIIMRKLLSIIVPVYKVEKYIDKCLSSLIVPKEQMELLDVVVTHDVPDYAIVGGNPAKVIRIRK